ncbi:uncharacterized protein LOC127750353 [Frankliniella occidentalis]|uniref:Uncharacterized protein LOC127750353 n=1 Tax=Frankliniella occidentalis TaxID=133901 RepID=A0A9C6X290_FRAOC|nr:uncharacterized protein LOC127750353 [Frankliniella occidentalis]XP_052127802.1 uncharacterized protein LOC127750353 [Frankliniella occidentalis]
MDHDSRLDEPDFRGAGFDGATNPALGDLSLDYSCAQCKRVVPGGMTAFQNHLQGGYHIPPFRCGQSNCFASYTNRRTLYGHLRDHHQSSTAIPSTPSSSNAPPAVCHFVVDEPTFDDLEGAAASVSENEHVLQSAAERSVLKLRSVAYMTNVAIQAVNDQCHTLMQDTATHLKQKVLDFLNKPEEDKNLDQLLQEFSIENPFEKLKTKSQQLKCFEKKYGLLLPQEIYLGETFVSRQHPKRPRLELTQVPKSYQYVSIIDILKGVMSDPYLRDLILSEKSSSDGFLRSFRDGALFKTLPPDLQGAIRIIIYVDDLEVLQALSSQAGVYKIAGIYFGIQNLPAELNSLLNYIFVTALANADDAKHKEVWEKFLSDMKKLETEGFDIVIDGVVHNFKAVLVAQIGDTLAAHEVLGFVSPSCHMFCRFCYMNRKDMWADGTKIGAPRTPERHTEDIRGSNNVVVVKATGVRGSPLLDGLRFFHCVRSSVPDIFHDLNQGVCKMEVKLALREFVCKKKYITEEELNSRIRRFDYGMADKKNRPSAKLFTFRYLNEIKNYNLHQTGAQMWLLVRSFPFLLGDLVPRGDKLFRLVCLLNEIMAILFARSICEYDLQMLDKLVHEHHSLFQEIFPGVPVETSMAAQQEEMQAQVELENSFVNPDDPEAEVVEHNEETLERPETDLELLEEALELPEEEFADEEAVPHDEEIQVLNQAEAGNVSTGTGKSTAKAVKKKPKVIRMINKHHHMLHYVNFIRNYGPLILYWCIRYEAKHYFFKLCATVCHNFKNILKTLMEILQMKIIADKLKTSKRLTMSKRGRELIYVSESLHRQELSAFGLQPGSKVYKVDFVVLDGVDYRPELYITEKLRTQFSLPVFACIKAVYVSSCEKHVFLLVQEWCTVKYDSHFCAYLMKPLRGSPIVVKEASMIPSYRLLSAWTPFDNSNDVYLAPRTIS